MTLLTLADFMPMRQVLNYSAWELQAFRDFLRGLHEEWRRPSDVPVVVKGEGSNMQLTLSPKYYQQVCKIDFLLQQLGS